MRKLNNKGYMLVEIILAFALAFGIAYFILDLTINLKNKNDDLMVETLVTTDQTIIANKIMEKILENNDIEDFDCSKISKSDQTIKYGDDLIVVVNDYAEVGDITCSNKLGAINVKVPLSVKQMSDKNFDAVIDYKYDIGDLVAPTCILSMASGGVINASCSDNVGGSGIVYQGFDENFSGESETSKTITVADTYKYYVEDGAGNEALYTMSIENIIKSCPSGYSEYGSNTQCRAVTSSWSCDCDKCTTDVFIGYKGGTACSNSGGWIGTDGGCYVSKTDWCNCQDTCYSYKHTDYIYSCAKEGYDKSIDNKWCYK